jgi:exopolysaccharide biosynthesis polyprenyl glycosylphosphotransferase
MSIAILVVTKQVDLPHISQFLSVRIKISNFVIFLIFLTVWHMVLSFSGLYKSRRLSDSKSEELVGILKATAIGSMIIYFTALYTHVDFATPVFLLSFYTAGSGLTIFGRLLMRYTIKKARVRGHNLRNLLIIGTNKRALRFARRVENQPEYGYRIVGFVDADHTANGEFNSSGYRLVANFSSFSEYLRGNVVDEVAVILPLSSLYQHAAKIVAKCEEQGITVRVLPDLFNLNRARYQTDNFDGEQIITISSGGANGGWPVIMKRLVDVVASVVLLILASPLLLICALLIHWTSPGPVFFVQKRVGFNKRRFHLYKFRTMVTGAEKMISDLEAQNEASGPVFKIKDDPRITRVGKHLRVFSLDELPQLINVIKGDMSLVGPRPLPVRDYDGFDLDWQRRRFSVRPGITCLWQISGRSNLTFEKWMKLDMEYIDNWSLALDMKILLKTIPAVLKGSGAA